MIDVRGPTNRVLTATQRKAYADALKQSRPVSVRVTLLNQNEREAASLTVPIRRVLEGQVDVDTTQEVSRQAALTVLDPDRKLKLASSSASAWNIWPDKFVFIERGDWVQALSGFCWAPVFWGPISKFSRIGPIVSLEAAGKEKLAMPPHVLQSGVHIGRGQNLLSAIRELMNPMGEMKYDVGGGGLKMREKLSVAQFEAAWPRVKKLANSKDNRQAFYDGRGVLRVRGLPGEVAWVFAPGDDSILIDEPDFSIDFSTFINRVVYTGGIPKGKRDQIRITSTLAPGHPLSPEALKRNGKPRYLTELVVNEDVKRQDVATRNADEILRSRAELGTEVQFSCLPVPHLEEMDRIRVSSDDQSATIRLKKFSIPLTAAAPMTIGYVRNQQWASGIRHKRRKLRKAKKKKSKKKGKR